MSQYQHPSVKHPHEVKIEVIIQDYEHLAPAWFAGMIETAVAFVLRGDHPAEIRWTEGDGRVMSLLSGQVREVIPS